MITKAYACINRNKIQRSVSSSGGIYPLLAIKVLEENGIVFAACYDDTLDVMHRKISQMDEISLSQGSKYVASKLNDTFNDIIKTIQENQKTLFVGTPCQCAGLIGFLKEKKIDRSKVFIVDFVCHGIPSRRVWNEYKISMKREGKELTSVNMRDKTSGWSRGNYSWNQKTVTGDEIITAQRQVPYMKGMLANLFLRPSCFECKFKGVDRQTDITLGDYWGIWDHIPDMDDDKGTSLVLIHTLQGKRMFDSIMPFIRFVDADIEKAIEGNSCITTSTRMNQKRKIFFRRLNKGEDFISIVDDLTKLSVWGRVKSMIKKAKTLGGGETVRKLIS